jgi:integrase
MSSDPVCGQESVGQLIERGVGWLKESGCPPSLVASSKGIWKLFAARTGNGRQAYSDRLGQTFLKSRGITKDQVDGRLCARKGEVRTAMQMLGEIHRSGGAAFSLHVLAHERFCREKKGMADGSIRRYSERLRHFLRFLGQQGVCGWDDFSAGLLSRFLHTLAPLRRATRRRHMDALRSFFRSLFCLGILQKDWTGYIPKIAPANDATDPYQWPPEETGRLLGAIDRSTASGKRDYAFLLLIARLGIRGGDAGSLRLENFDWAANAIRFVQEKTGIPHVLPLLPDVGMAVVDYLRHGRPASPCREVFLRHRGPGNGSLSCSAMYGALKKAKRKAGLSISKDFRAGLHSFRHSLATRLLEEGVPWPSISGVMGHVDPDTTQIYAKSSTFLLRKVALDPEEVRHG